MYGLTPEDLDLQRRARAFTDELIPFELDGRGARRPSSPTRSTKAHHERAIELGLLRHQHADLGRRSRLHSAAAGAGPGAGRSGHQRHRAGAWHPAVLVARGRQRPPARDAGCCRPCAARWRSATRSPRRTPAPTSPTSTATARRDGDDYVLDGVKWHVTSFNEADYVFFQAVLTDRPARRRPGPVRRRQGRARRARRAHAGVHAHARARTTRSSRSRACGSRPRTSSAARGTACRSSTSGSGSSG